ncbi:hypothetical protein ACMXYQ_13210 [Neptuniibacter sp. PT34_22]|uniref:hypothetical protein n=1 Tax=Neptuniibacter sp. PT34_22 TaxID=3398205 RepID=UPI0039F61D23
MKEFRNASDVLDKSGRFHFYEISWESDNQIKTKFDGMYLYFGPTALFSVFIKPIKIPVGDLVYTGKKKYWLSTRDVYEFKEVYGYKIGISEGSIESIYKD